MQPTIVSSGSEFFPLGRMLPGQRGSSHLWFQSVSGFLKGKFGFEHCSAYPSLLRSLWHASASEPQPKVDANASFEIISVYCFLCSCVKHSLELLDEAETQEKHDKTGALNAIREVFCFFSPAPFSAAKVQALLGFFGRFLCWPASGCV